ncbi:MAG: arylsulfatase [Sphingobacteriaceae bacterium]|jgi:arylsulfatase A-like enzyme|nr:arylsulfatase [Sphingobacteriaceae bacterium]
MNKLTSKFNIVFAAALLACASSFAQNNAKPNVIFILADDLGYGDIGVYGQKLIATPNIDALAANGMRFTQFYAGTSVCAPSRASLMTGLHTGHAPIRGNKEMVPEGQFPMKASAFTIAEMFKNAGYATGDFGKWGLGSPGSEGEPNKQGFDTFYGYNCQRLAHDYFPDHLWSNTSRIGLPNTLEKPAVYAPELIQAQALKFIEANKSKPFFQFLSYTLPHAGLEVPKGDKFFEQYKKKFNESPKDVKLEKVPPTLYAGQPYPHAAYAAMVSRLDMYVGQVVAKLKELGIDKNTLIVFSSDNGPHVEGGNEPAFFNSQGGLKGVKRDLYEGGIREPMIISWPAVVRKGTTSDHIGAFWDFLPTFADIAGQPKPSGIDGLSIYPVLKSQKNAQQHDYLYWEFHENGGRQAVRIGNWKGVKLDAIKNPDSPIELYDLSTDRSESSNVAESHPEIVSKIAALMKTAHVENPDFPFTAKE